MKRIFIIPIILILNLAMIPGALNAMEGAQTTKYCDGDIELAASATQEIVDNNDKPLSPYFRNYTVKLQNWTCNPTTRMNIVEYCVKSVNEDKVLASGTAQAAFNTFFLRRLNKEARLKITFINK
jgi:hypothetical protein